VGAIKPIMLILWEDMLMRNFSQDFQSVLREGDLAELFDVYYCGDEKVAA
jgi:hypothetical protein